MSVPRPTITRNVQNTTVELGRSSGANSFKPGMWPSQLMGQNQAAENGDFESVACRFGCHIRPAEEDQRNALSRHVFPMALDRCDFGWLMLQGIEAVLVANNHLHRRNQEHHPHRHRQHRSHASVIMPFQEVPGACSADEQGGGQ